MIDYILNPQSVEALGWTLLHSLWQGAVFSLLLVGILIALRSYSAQSRYVVSVGVLCAFFLTVSATFGLQWQEASSRLEGTTLSLHKEIVEEGRMGNIPAKTIVHSEMESKNAMPITNEIVDKDQSTWLLECRNYYERHLPLLVTLWLLGVFFLQLRLLGQLAYVQRLKHYGAQLFPSNWSDKIEELEGKLRIQKKVAYLTSMRIESPMVIGWLKPVVLMPQQLFDSLSETEIYAVLAHELAHIRREDFMVNLLQTFLCNVFFFHPGVWWMSNRIDDEREHCCDDLAVAATGPALSYAKTLINVSAFQLKQQKNSPLAMALSGKRGKKEEGGFSGRIRRLFKVSNGAGSFREGFATAFILMAALFFGVVATGSTVQASEVSIPMDIATTEISSDKDAVSIEEVNREANKQANRIANKEAANKEVAPRATLKNMDVKPHATVTTISTIKIENKPISNFNQGLDLSELPIAAPAAPAPLAEPFAPAEPFRSYDTRIDALVSACEEGDLEFVKTLINVGIDINGIGSEGFTALMMAASEDEAEIVAYLLQQGADVNQQHNGWTALLEAADEGSLRSMKHLLKAGAEVDFYWTQESPTAISMAASEGHLECLQLLVEYGANINGIGKSVPPLHNAAEEDKRAILKYLISQNVKINKKDAAGRTALMYAASEGQEYAVTILVEAGADISIVDFNGATAKDYAAAEGEYETLAYLNGEEEYDTEGQEDEYDKRDYSSAEKRPAIHQLTLDGRIEKVQRMVEQGTDVNTIDAYGRTPLHIASAEGHNIDMGVLIDLGADINAQDKQGRTPLMYAAADGKGNAVALLVSKVVDVDIQDVDGMSAYDWARSGGNTDLAKFLGLITEKKNNFNNNSKNKNSADNKESRSYKAHKRIEKEAQRIQKEEQRLQKEMERIQKEAQRSHKETEKREALHVAADGLHLRQYDLKEKTPALLEAVRNGSIADCAKLLNNGLTPNAADDTGQTALMVAASTNRLDIAKFLIEQGADVNKRSASGLTALHYAALENGAQMARLLLENKAKVDATMRYSSTDGNYGTEPLVWEYIGATPLLIAVESKNIEVLSVLIEAGANTNHTLIRKEYLLNKNRESYLTGGEVMGIDKDFLQEVDFQTSDASWTPYKQALLLKDAEILKLFQK